MEESSSRKAARALGLSTAGLRRNAQAYEAVFGRIARDNGGRVYSDEVLGRLKAARALRKSGRAPSLEAALERVREDLRGAYGPSRSTGSSFEAEVTARLDALTTAVERLTETCSSLERVAGPVPTKDERGDELSAIQGDEQGDGLEPPREVGSLELIHEDRGQSADAPQLGERPAEALPDDAPPEDATHEQSEPPRRTEGGKTKPVTLYLSEEVRRFLGIGKVEARGSMSEQVEALVREEMRAYEEAE